MLKYIAPKTNIVPTIECPKPNTCGINIPLINPMIPMNPNIQHTTVVFVTN